MKLFSQYDRFDLEQDILKVWGTEETIDELIRQHYDRPQGPFSDDELANKLDAIKHLIGLHCQRMWDGYEVMLKNGSFVKKTYKPDVDLEINNIKSKGNKK